MFVVVGGLRLGRHHLHRWEGARMGPGYFPLMLGILLAIIGAP
jgi:hypothetical protein